MLDSLKKETGHDKPKDKSTNKKNLSDNTHPLPPTHTLIWINHPPPIPSPPIIHNNNTMDTELLVQMRQSNKFGSIRNDQISHLHLRFGAGTWVSRPWLLEDTSRITDSICPNTKKQKNPEMRLNSQQFISPCLGLRAQNTGLRQVDLEPSIKRGNDKVNMLK